MVPALAGPCGRYGNRRRVAGSKQSRAHAHKAGSPRQARAPHIPLDMALSRRLRLRLCARLPDFFLLLLFRGEWTLLGSWGVGCVAMGTERPGPPWNSGLGAGAVPRAVGSGLGLTRVDAAGPGQGHGRLDSRRTVAATSRARKLTGENAPSAAWCPKSWTTSGWGSSSQGPALPGAAGVNKEAERGGKAGHPCAEMELHRDEHRCRSVVEETLTTTTPLQ